MMARLQLLILGGFHVHVDGDDVTAFESDKVRALLAYLALEADRPHRREKLAGILWPEIPERQARHNLSQALFNLRQAIGERGVNPAFLISTPQTIQLNGGEHTWLDVAEFSQTIQACRTCQECSRLPTACDSCLERLEQAAELYRGRFLEGLTLEGCLEFDDWQRLQSQYLQRQAVEVLARLVYTYQARGEIDRMLAHATRWAAIDAYDEAAQRAVMLALALRGQRGAALAQYETCRQVLQDELGVEPAVETRELYQQLLENEIPLESASLPAIRGDRPAWRAVCPYRGLAAFREVDAPYFFGHQAFTERLYATVCEQPLAILVGPSGSGKSSLVFAGLLPRLREEGDWLIADFRPGAEPFQTLASRAVALLEPEMSQTDRLVESGKLASALEAGEISLYQLAEQIVEGQPGKDRLLLIADQFEELYTLCPEAETRRRYLDVLLDTVAAANGLPEPRLVLLITLRADFMGQALAHRPFANALQEAALIMGPMNRDELRSAIEEPAELQGAAFEARLVERLLDDVGQEPGNLPLLEFALTLLWEKARFGWLTHAAYEEIGRVQGALANYADQVYEGLATGDQQQARRIFLQLVKPGEGTEDTRRVASRAELGEANWALIQRLADRRLVVTGRDASGSEMVEVVHEALIQGWGQLRAWIDKDRAFRAWQERLRDNLRQWKEHGHDEGALLRGAALILADEWLSDRRNELGNTEVEFIRASLALRERRQKEKERQRRRVITGMAVGLVIALLLIVLIWQQRQAANRQASIGLAAQAMSELNGSHPERAVPLALEALENYPYTWQAERALGQAVLDGKLRHILPHDDYVNTAQWSADGTRILTGSSDGSVRLWDALSGEELLRISDGAPTLASWSPDERSILTINTEKTIVKIWDLETGLERFALSQKDFQGELNINAGDWQPWAPSGDKFLTQNLDGLIKIWDAGSGKTLRVLSPSRPTSELQGKDALSGDWDNKMQLYLGEKQDQALWSPDSKLILVSSNTNSTLAVWDAITGEERYSLPGSFEDQRILAAGWSPSGEYFATRGLGGAKVYNAATGQELINFHTPGVYIYRVSWSPDGTRIFTAGIEDHSARIWDAQNGQELLAIADLGQSAGTDWSSNDDFLAVGGPDGIVHVWEPAKGMEIMQLFGTQPRTTKVLFSPDGKRMLTVGDDHVVNVYDLFEDLLRIDFPTGPLHFISFAKWSPNGEQVAIGTDDKTARVWDASTGEEKLVLSGHDGGVWTVDWSPSGERIVTGAEDHTARVWDATTGRQQLIFSGHQDIVMNAFWSLDGGRIASSDISSDKALVWNSSNGELVLTFTGHTGIVNYLSWSPDGERILSTGAHGEAFIWDPDTGKILVDLVAGVNNLDIVMAAWTNDGQQVFLRSADGIIRIFDAANGHELKHFAVPPSLSQISISPTEKRLLTGGDGGANVIDIDTGAQLLHISDPGWVDSAYSPDGRRILIGSNQGKLRILPAWHSVEELIAYARNCCVVRELTLEERELYGLPSSK